MDPTPENLAPASSEALAGDIAPFAQALGESEILASLTALAKLVDAPTPQSASAVESFLARYRDRLLARVELPAIREAYELAADGKARELIELDRRLASQFGRSAFTEASRFAGRLQLRRLRPLRNATLQRYLHAVESGEASGWHLVVFGLLLALFSLPLRQGLAHYAVKTQLGLLESASRSVAVTAPERARLRRECEEPVASVVQQVVPGFVPKFA
jgi:urease accessory protein UreF